MKKYAIFLLVALAIIVVGWNLAKRPTTPVAPVVSSPTVTIGNRTYTVTIADDDAERMQGLSGTDQLGENEGKLFLFPKKATYPFWMKHMKYSIDIVWIDGETIVEIAENVPAPVQGQTDLPIYTPKAQSDKVLEINAGEAQKYGFTIGSRVSFSNITFQERDFSGTQ